MNPATTTSTVRSTANRSESAVHRTPSSPVPALRPAPAPEGEVVTRAWPVHGALALSDPAPRNPTAAAVALPEPQAWVETFVRVACEVGAGRRPPAQLQRWTTGDVFATLARRHALAARAPQQANRGTATVVRSVRCCAVEEWVREASAVVVDRGRVRAVALRLEAVGGRWRVTALEIG